MKTLNLSDAIYVQSLNANYKIGLIRTEVSGLASRRNIGDIVLFEEENDKTCTIHTPYNKKQIEANRKNGSLIDVFGTMIGVPLEYITEVKL